MSSTVLISGASGFIGSRLARSFAAEGHRIARLVRPGTPQPTPPATERAVAAVSWDPESGRVDAAELERARADVVINLAGEPIAHRWTDERRRRIRDSRVKGTRALATALASLETKPSVLISGSAIGYYGAHRGDELLDESSAAGDDFLARTVHDWEEAAEPAARAGMRVVTVRTGLVVGKDGGLLARLLTPFKLGVGGRVGNGEQWMSWVALDDVVRVFRFLVGADLQGPVNMVAPEPVRNVQFTEALAAALNRPAVVPVPSAALKLVFGTMADDTILASQRVVPKRLAGAGFEFRHPRLEEALRFELRR